MFDNLKPTCDVVVDSYFDDRSVKLTFASSEHLEQINDFFVSSNKPIIVILNLVVVETECALRFKINPTFEFDEAVDSIKEYLTQQGLKIKE